MHIADEAGGVWRLISIWDRTDGSVARVDRWSTRHRPPRGAERSIRRGRSSPPTGTDVGARAAAALGPIVASHGIDVRPQPSADSVVWCSRVRTVDQDVDPGDPGWCTDLWVHLDDRARTIAVSLEGYGLAEHVTGRTHWDGPISVDLAGDLESALAVVARHLDRLCGDVLERV